MKASTQIWEKIKSFDDIIQPEERKIIEQLNKDTKNKCPHLKKEGQFFHYCGKGLNEKLEEDFGPLNSKYIRHVDVAKLQLYCLSNFDNCCFYSGKSKKCDCTSLT